MAQATLQSSLEGELQISVEIKAPAKEFYNMLIGRPQDVPKASPDNVQGCEVCEGECGKVGNVIHWNVVIEGQPKVIKQRIEALDSEKNISVAKVIDGDLLKDFKNVLVTVQATPKQQGSGSVAKFHVKYERINEKVAHPEYLLELFVKACKDMDEMLMLRV